MIKLFIKLSLALSLLFAGVSQATILPLNVNDLTTDDYIVYNHDGVDYDIVWASKVNSERYYDLGVGVNTLFAASYRESWSFTTPTQLLWLKELTSNGELSSLLTREDGSYIHGFQYWNSLYIAPDNTRNIDSALIGSEWVWNVKDDDTYEEGTMNQALEILNRDGSNADTFYIRATKVPEPSTLMIFALGLIALASKKRLFS